MIDIAFRVTPSIEAESSAKKTQLVSNGTQSAAISIELDLHKKLTFVDGSIQFDYSDDECGYNEHELDWIVDVNEGADGSYKIILTTFVSDIDLKLPTFTFVTDIGDVLDPDKDVKNNEKLDVKAVICAEYEETSLTAAQNHSDTASINVIIEQNDGITKGVRETLVEVGEPLVYTLSYMNNDESAHNIEFSDVLPYNGDNRGTDFTGGYALEKIEIQFSDEASCISFAQSGRLTFMTGKTEPQNSEETKALMELLSESEERSVTTIDSKTVSYVFADNIIQRAEMNSGIALYGYLPNISGKGRFVITVTMSPLYDGELITSDDKTQTGDSKYFNTFSYRTLTTNRDIGSDTEVTNKSTPVISNVVKIVTISREISGIVWIDRNQNGIYDNESEQALKNIDVYLYESDGVTEAKDIFGKEVAVVKTDEHGKYIFENLTKGDYIVKFKDDDNDYVLSETDSNRPISFDKLSVTTLENKTSNRGNRTKPEYNEYGLADAVLYTSVKLPEKNKIASSPYSSPNWNCGLYYTEIKLEKQWKNMVNGIPDKTGVNFNIIPESVKLTNAQIH